MALSFKKSVRVIQDHYGTERSNTRKLLKLFFWKGDKKQAILDEASRIVELRRKINLKGRACELCGCFSAEGEIVYARTNLQFSVKPNKTTRKGWRQWTISSPTLCRKCEYKTKSVLAQYNELIELYNLANKLSRTKPNERQK